MFSMHKYEYSSKSDITLFINISYVDYKFQAKHCE